MASHESYYDTLNNSTRSPSGQHQPQHNTLHRAASRQFDTFAGPTGLYTAEDHAARYDHRAYDTTRINPTSMAYGGYEASGAQTWNPSSFVSTGVLAPMGGSGRIKGSRQRSALPQVRPSPPTLKCVRLLISNNRCGLKLPRHSQLLARWPEWVVAPVAVVSVVSVVSAVSVVSVVVVVVAALVAVVLVLALVLVLVMVALVVAASCWDPPP